MNLKQIVKKVLREAKEVDLPNTNLIVRGFGRDQNGNSLIQLSFYDGTKFTLQTGNLQKTHSIKQRGVKASELDESELQTIRDEVVDYIQNYGSKLQKSKLKSYPN